MIDTLRGLLWVAASFVVTLLIASTFVMGRGGGDIPELDQRENKQPVASQLVGHTIAVSTLIEAQSRAPILDRGITVPDTAIVVLLGAIGCSMNQMKVLQQWSQRSDAPYPILAVYADYLMSEAASSHESLVLRRVSQAEFPFLVSSDTTLSPRGMNMTTPQVVLVESGVIARVLPLAPTPLLAAPD